VDLQQSCKDFFSKKEKIVYNTTANPQGYTPLTVFRIRHTFLFQNKKKFHTRSKSNSKNVDLQHGCKELFVVGKNSLCIEIN
jgi:hypothetical protein